MSDEFTEVTASAIDEKSQEGLPLLLWPIVFRFALAAWFVGLTIYQVIRDWGQLPIWGYWVFMLASAGPSALIAIGLLARRSWAGWLAAGGDCTLGALFLGSCLAALSPNAYGPPHAFRWGFDGVMMAVWALSCIEGIYLIRKLSQTWWSILPYLPVATAFFCIGWDLGLLGD